MLEPDRVDTVAQGLTACLHDGCDLSTAPQFQLIVLWEPPQQRPTLDFQDIHETVWRRWDTARQLPTVVGAQELADLLARTATGWLPDLGGEPDAALIGCSLMYDEPASDATGDATAGRVLVARDTDGRLYQGRYPAGGGVGDVRVSDDAPSGCAAVVAEALATILDHRILTVFRLPTTGYIVQHTVHRDGEQPYDATCFIDAANTMDDGTAIAHVQGDLEELHTAPRNVEHTLRLIYRTEAGDRAVWTGEPVRGDGPPIE
jgi:hypothetical protein